MNVLNVTHKGQGGDARVVSGDGCFVDSVVEWDIDIFLFTGLKDGMANIFTQEHFGRWE